MQHRAPLALVAAAVAMFAVALQLHLHALGLVQTAAGAATLVTCSALALNASRVRPMPTRQAVPAALAATVGNTLTPMGLGGSALSARMHARTGLSGDEALAAVTLRAVASGVAGLLTAAVAAAWLGLPRPTLPGSGHTTALVLVVLVVGGVAFGLACPLRRGRVAAHARGVVGAVAGVLKHPARTVVLILGATGVICSQLLILDGAVRAVGGHIGIGSVLVTFVGSSAARAAVPTPGGVGPVEAALVAGLSALGLPMATAAVAVAVYRTAGLWLPVGAGIFALRALRRQHLL
ncbi:MAG: glycosyltransferase 2 family protein [Actinomycetota bacterium]|nr:glycosyltransferase 2 family protein [Actinomycetota bacterium]